MPKASVRAAIADYLDPANSAIPSLGAVYQALPKVANEEDLFSFQPPGAAVGATIYLFIEDQYERRIGVGGPNSGQKERVYTVSLLCIFKSDLETSFDGQAAFDEFIDALTARIEADRTAGTSGNPVFQWGEGTTEGAPDVRFQFIVPKTSRGGVMLFQAVGRVTAIEMLTT